MFVILLTEKAVTGVNHNQQILCFGTVVFVNNAKFEFFLAIELSSSFHRSCAIVEIMVIPQFSENHFP